jgi:hypothetical protein
MAVEIEVDLREYNGCRNQSKRGYNGCRNRSQSGRV